MSRRFARLVAALLMCVTVSGCSAKPEANAVAFGPPPWIRTIEAKGPVSRGWTVTHIVDGDTVDVTHNRRTLRVRLIGIDSPETVHPFQPVECFGPEATAFAEHRLLGDHVTLEFDRTQGHFDYYGRTLAYIWDGGGHHPRLFNETAVRLGYAEEYTYDAPYTWQGRLQHAESSAASQGRGLWGACR